MAANLRSCTIGLEEFSETTHQNSLLIIFVPFHTLSFKWDPVILCAGHQVSENFIIFFRRPNPQQSLSKNHITGSSAGLTHLT